MYSEWARACEGLIEVGEILCQNRHHPFSATSANVRSVKAMAMDEWKAMWAIFEMIQEPAFAHWVRREKLRCLYAARNEVKMQFMGRLDPAVPPQIASVSRELLSPSYRLVGKTAVMIRDAILRMKGLPTKAEDLYRIYSHARAK
jgi:hypothetical protein